MFKIFVPKGLNYISYYNQNATISFLSGCNDELDYLRDYQEFVAYQTENSGEV